MIKEITSLKRVNLAFVDKGLAYDIKEISLKPDLQGFFSFYKVINAIALSEMIKVWIQTS